MPITRVESACPLDCPDGCSLSVTVENGKVTVIDGSHANPATEGFICHKVRRFGERVYGPERLLYPQIRKGPKGLAQFERASWNDAMALIATRFSEVRERWGGSAILPVSYGGSNGLLTQDTSDAALFARLGASRLARTLCAAPTGAANMAMYGKMPSVTYQDVPDARFIVLWGLNPSASGIHLVPYVREAQKQGATLVVIDPRVTPLARQADIHLAVKPGTDLPVALAIHRFLFEEGHANQAFLDAHTSGAAELRAAALPWTFERAAAEAGVDAADLRRVAEGYAAASPALIRCGWGPERNRNGGSATLAILGLPAVAGKFGVRGGGYSMSNSGSWNLSRPWVEQASADIRQVNLSRLGHALTALNDPPVQALFVYNCNPAVTVPDQSTVLNGLEREDLFTVVFDQVMTDTARYADVILPATTFLEHYDVVRAYGPIAMTLGRPAIEPVGEARPNADVFGELIDRLDLGRDGDARGELEEMLQVMAAIPSPAGDGLRDHGAATPEFGGRPVQFVDVFPRTADSRVHLWPEVSAREATAGLYVYQPDPGTERFPLALISPASDRTISSTLGELPNPESRLLIHPDDAAARGIATDHAVRIFNAQGEVRCKAHVAPWIRPGTISLPKGLWFRHTANGRTTNTLIPDTLSDLGGGACYNDARVQVEAIAQ